VVDEDAVIRAIADGMAKYGRIDVWSAMPASRSSRPVVDFPFAEWKKMLAIHLDGAFLTQGVPEAMYDREIGQHRLYEARCIRRRPSRLKEPVLKPYHGLIGGLIASGSPDDREFHVRAKWSAPASSARPLVDKQIPEQAREAAHTEEQVNSNSDAQRNGGWGVHHDRYVADAVLFFAGASPMHDWAIAGTSAMAVMQ